MASSRLTVTTPTLARLRKRQKYVQKESDKCLKNMKKIASDTKQSVTGKGAYPNRISEIMAKCQLIYKGLKIGLQVASVIKRFWPKKKSKK